jgi:NAD(P)-dependent dehydrogenase (short-subunit alcohol dehydrogenase family)
MSPRLMNKVAVITGAASGIGKATALRFVSEGARVVLGDINETALQEIAALIGVAKGTVAVRTTDVASEASVKALIDLALKTHGEIDILVNNAGIAGDMAGPDQQEEGVWRRVFEVNVLGALFATKHVSAHMMERRQGAIINTASVAGIRSGAGGNAYSASKAALINYTQTTACDLGAYNIRVNAVCPGLVETGMTQPLFDYARGAGKENKLGSRCELRRYGRPEEIASVISFLASDDASYITGQAIPVDGGNTASLNLPGMKF